MQRFTSLAILGDNEKNRNLCISSMMPLSLHPATGVVASYNDCGQITGLLIAQLVITNTMWLYARHFKPNTLLALQTT